MGSGSIGLSGSSSGSSGTSSSAPLARYRLSASLGRIFCVELALAAELHLAAAVLHLELRARLLFVLDLVLNGLTQGRSPDGYGQQRCESDGNLLHGSISKRI